MVLFFRTIILYIIVVFIMRVMGKRQIGELQPFELVIAIMLSDLASVPMQDTGIPLIHGVIPIVTLLFLQILFSYLTLKSQNIRKVLCGVPSIIIENGIVDEKELAKQRFNLDDLLEELRMSGYFNISDIQYGIIENNGKLSIIPKSEKSPVTLEDMNIKVSKNHLPISLILDGVVNDHNLKEVNKTVDWLNSKLRENKINNPKDVFIAMLDTKGKIYIQRRTRYEK